ncbi:MAG TPA: GTPase HflX [Candidatus Acidoferrales bacterium]|nr:GTPase HflX [Candidatus Acidoferrales bacterium]
MPPGRQAAALPLAKAFPAFTDIRPERFLLRMKTSRPTVIRERALLVGVGLKKAPRLPGLEAGEAERESLIELEELTRSAGGEVAGSVFQLREVLDPATIVGRGKLEEIKVEARMREAPLVVFDRNLTPVQQRNIERATDCRVIDRTQLILDIFARHARSREGQLQVELAQLNYLLPRLAGHGTELSRLGGGIGTRGPGEQKLETDRRRIRDRIRKIGQSIETLRRQRSLRRAARQAVPLGTVALVGYTNAGKSTLFNALSRAEVRVSPQMFATLDPTVRAVRLPSNRRVLLSDTVGFIRDLPPGLLTAFRATLEEVQEAALILHVSDISNPHHAEQDAEVEKVLAELGVVGRPRLHVFNKIDLLSPDEAAALSKPEGNLEANGNVFVSALAGAGLEELLRRIDLIVPVDPVVRLEFSLPLADGRTLALVYALGRVIRSEVRDSQMAIEAELPESVAHRLKLQPNAPTN